MLSLYKPLHHSCSHGKKDLLPGFPILNKQFVQGCREGHG
jgi:hypothetical protein